MGEKELTTPRNFNRYSRLMLGAPTIYEGIIPTIIDYRAVICAGLANDTVSLAIMPSPVSFLLWSLRVTNVINRVFIGLVLHATFVSNQESM